MIETSDLRHENEPDKDGAAGVDRDALADAHKKLGLTARFLPARVEDDRSDDGIADLAEGLHAERKALLAGEDRFTEQEYAALEPLLSTFKANFAPQRDIRSVLEQLLMIKRLRCAFRHAPGVQSPDCLRQRQRSLSLREAGSRFTEIYQVARSSGIFRVSVLERLRELAEWSERLRDTVAQKRRAAGEEALRRADARS